MRQEVDPEANIIVGATFDETLGDRVRVSIVASGMARIERAGGADAAQSGRYARAQHAPEPAAAGRAARAGLCAFRRRGRHQAAPDGSDRAEERAGRRRPPCLHPTAWRSRCNASRIESRIEIRSGKLGAHRAMWSSRKASRRRRGRSRPRAHPHTRAMQPRAGPSNSPRRPRRTSAAQRAVCPTSTTSRRSRSASTAPRSDRRTSALRQHHALQVDERCPRRRRGAVCCSA